MKVRRLSAFARRSLDVSITALWMASAVGHAWLLAAKWGQMSGGQALILVLAIVSSLFFMWLSRSLWARPERLLVVALLVCLAHVPLGAVDQPGVELLPAVVAALGLIALGGLRSFQSSGAGLLSPEPAPVTGVDPPIPLGLGFSHFSRPPPML